MFALSGYLLYNICNIIYTGYMMEKKKKLIIDILIVILLCIMAFSGWKLYSNYKRAQDSENRFKDLESVLQQKDNNGN